MLAVPNFIYSNATRGSNMQQAALMFSKFMTPLRHSNITPLSFVSIQLEKVGPFTYSMLQLHCLLEAIVTVTLFVQKIQQWFVEIC